MNQKIVDLRRDANEEFVEKAVFLSVANQCPFFRKKWPFFNYGFFLVSRSDKSELQSGFMVSTISRIAV